MHWVENPRPWGQDFPFLLRVNGKSSKLLDEIEIIKGFFPKGKLPLDDCSFFPPQLLVTTDSLVEGTHFRLDWSSPEQIAQKLVEVNVSDIAASGGQVGSAFLNFGLPISRLKKTWIRQFQKAFQSVMKKYEIELSGGDTFASPHLFLALTLTGETQSPWLRTGAMPGDFVYITGNLGYSLWGYEILKKGKVPQTSKEKLAVTKHLAPISRYALVKSLSHYRIHSCMDTTDGLVQDSEKLSQASRVPLELEVSSIPTDKETLDAISWDGVLTSGEELELLFTSPDSLPGSIHGTRITRIGKVLDPRGKGPKVLWKWEGKQYKILNRGFLHFS